jgi:cupin 2 domain-containing protein
MNTKNIFSAIPPPSTDEFFETLLHHDNVRIERIVSHGHSSPPGFWYDQDLDEWVMLLQGKAKILFENDVTPIELSAGVHLNIPAHRRHRVEWTAPGEDTVWLAVHC